MPNSPQAPQGPAQAFAAHRPGQMRASRGYSAMSNTSTGQSLASTVRSTAGGLKPKPMKKPTLASPMAAGSAVPTPTGPPKPVGPKKPTNAIQKSHWGISAFGVDHG